MANQFLSLSLFLMLLSFFIVMNAVSEYEDTKSQPVLNSLSIAFSKDPVKPVANSSFEVNQILEKKNSGDTLDALEGIFNAHIAGFDVKKNWRGTTMHVRVPLGRFENSIDFPGASYSDVTIGMRGSFLPTLVTLLRSEDHGKPYRMDMLLNVPKEPTQYFKDSPNDYMYALGAVSDLAIRLERAGLPENMLSVGLVEGDPSYIDLYFYRYEAFDLANLIERQGGELGE